VYARGIRQAETARDIDMKVFIRSRSTKHFLAEDGTWTADQRCAIAYQGLDSVLQAVFEHQLKDVEAYYAFGEVPTPYDFIAPLLD
jgi:hypothetical protein